VVGSQLLWGGGACGGGIFALLASRTTDGQATAAAEA
jgi:hypothetical protein